MKQYLAIFGATGDLAARHLFPALAELHEAGKLPDGAGIIGLAREVQDTASFRSHVRAALETHAGGVSVPSRDAIVARIEYRPVDVEKPGAVAQILRTLDGPVIAYLALPTGIVPTVIRALSSVELPGGSRVVIEKPFGEDLAAAQALNKLLHAGFPESAIYRIDHFLHKQTIQNILGVRFANRVFEYLWNRDHIERVDIIWDEELTVHGRTGYYDRAGALRDMVQNHLLQLLCLVAMEPPLTVHERDLRNRKVDLLRAVRRMSKEEIGRLTTRARYTVGRVDGHAVPAYESEPGADRSRRTETFARVTLHVDNWRWQGVPFVLRTGKALGHDRREIAIRFRRVPHAAFDHPEPQPNVFRMQLAPDRMALGLNINAPGDPFDLEPIELDAALAPEEISAYGRLILSVFENECTLSIRADEAEESWRIIEPILEAWKAGDVPLLEYAAGSDGPPE